MLRKGGPLKVEYFCKNSGRLGGNGNSMVLGGGKWERYHQTKLANACFSAALAAKLQSANIINVKAVCAAPGLSQTNLQTTTQQVSGAMSGYMWSMHLSQSAEDGSIPLITACFGKDVANGDFYEPKGVMRGLPIKVSLDKHSSNPQQQKMLWTASEEAVGQFSI